MTFNILQNALKLLWSCDHEEMHQFNDEFNFSNTTLYVTSTMTVGLDFNFSNVENLQLDIPSHFKLIRDLIITPYLFKFQNHIASMTSPY